MAETYAHMIKVLSTTDYDQFIFMPHNRKTLDKHIKNLANSIRKNGFSIDDPILVYENKDGQKVIVDGQHRLMAAVEANSLVYYKVIKEEEWREKIVSRNALSRAWGAIDYLNHFVSLGYEPYITIKEFITRHQIILTSSLSLLKKGYVGGGGDNHKGNNSVSAMFKRGDIIITPEELKRGNELARKINNIRHFSEHYSKFAHERNFLTALTRAVTHPKYNEDRMLTKLALMSTKVVRCVDTPSYLKILADIYNYQARTRNRIDFLDRNDLEDDGPELTSDEAIERVHVSGLEARQ